MMEGPFMPFHLMAELETLEKICYRTTMKILQRVFQPVQHDVSGILLQAFEGMKGMYKKIRCKVWKGTFDMQ